MFNITSKFKEYYLWVNKKFPALPKLNGLAVKLIDFEAVDAREK